MAAEYPGKFVFNNVKKPNKNNANNRTKKRNNMGQPGVYSHTNDPGSKLFPMSAIPYPNNTVGPGAQLYAPSNLSSSFKDEEKEPGMNAPVVASARLHPFHGMSDNKIRKKFKESLYENTHHTLAKSYWNRLNEPSRDHYNDLLDEEEVNYLLDMFAMHGIDTKKKGNIQKILAHPVIGPVLRAQHRRHERPTRGGMKRTRRSK